jgi:endonuclease/exonuclease/phosphatase family metal-dependent hydrolase
MSSFLTVTTANTAYSEALKPENIHHLASTDVLLAQEVLGLERKKLEANLGMIGLRIAAIDEESGLLIAIHEDNVALESTKYHVIQPANRLNDLLEHIALKPRFRPRGLLTALLRTIEREPFIVATAHPIVCVRALSRVRQIRTIGEILAEEDPETPLIYGADMNHYPSPHKADTDFMTRLKLVPAQNSGPTFKLEGTKHSWLRRAGLPDGVLDMLASRGLLATGFEHIKISSDHDGLRASFQI